MDLKFYSIEEAAELLNVNYQLIYKLVKSGEMPSVRIGKVFRISEAQLQNYLDRQSLGLPASGIVEHICSRCGRKFYSALSMGGECKECGAPLCKICVEHDHASYCEIHQQKSDSEGK